jgi:hypothetical protein
MGTTKGTEMAYNVRGGKLVKSDTTVTEHPYVPTGYKETEAEQQLRAQGRVKELVRRDYRDGRVKFVIPGLEPDTAETLIADGLITEENLPDGRTIHTFLEPYNLRVIAWAMGVNEFAKSQGLGEVFPIGHIAEVVHVAPATETQQ